MDEEMTRLKELKVQVPTAIYLKLHQLKILNGTRLSDVVARALQDYLQDAEGAAREQGEK